VQIDAKIVAPHVLKNSNIFTLGFLFPYGKNQKKTEAFVVKKSTIFKFIESDWKTESVASRASLGYVKESPTISMFFTSKQNSDWQRMSLVENKKVLKISMRRNFISGDKKRVFYLGTTRPWTVGFIDKDYDNKIWSPSMDLVLDSCFPINRPYS